MSLQVKRSDSDRRWEFWIDRGGTFTDIVAKRPDGTLVTYKLLSEDPEHYKDAAVEGIRRLIGLGSQEPITPALVRSVKMGTTVATNALLERKGEPTVLCITKGFGDALRIAYQNRPDLFARQIVLPEALYSRVIEVVERVDAGGDVVTPLDVSQVHDALAQAYQEGLRSVAIVLMHGYKYPAHELDIEHIAREIGFEQISVSHRVSPLIKLVGRGDTTVLDAYLSPILWRYVEQVAREMPGVDLLFMQSNGGLTEATKFQGKDAILSGPAGGIVGMVRASSVEGYDKVIGFDMGGTSTDVSHFSGTYERTFETLVAGVRVRAPMMSIHTVAAGGGSILKFDGTRFRVGPESAGSNPGPASYRRGGPLTVTDCNVLLGRVQVDFFPKVFGPHANEPLDRDIVRAKFEALALEAAEKTGTLMSAEEVAEGFLRIAVNNMASAIKHISLARGYDVTEYALVTFGGAGGQHACRVAESLGMQRIFIHKYAGVLSAYGIGIADRSVIVERSVEMAFSPDSYRRLVDLVGELNVEATNKLNEQSIGDATVQTQCTAYLRYEGTDTAVEVAWGTFDEMQRGFDETYQRRFSFLMPDRRLVVSMISVEAIARSVADNSGVTSQGSAVPVTPKATATARMYVRGEWHDVPLFVADQLRAGDVIEGPAIISDRNSTTVVDPGWKARSTERGNLVMEQYRAARAEKGSAERCEPIMLEVMNNLFMSIADQMGVQLANTAYSVNIKERLDFSCAIFDAQGNLVANAPHIPVHLGSMGDSVRAVMNANQGAIKPGDVFMLNNPYAGGTHLPDVTVVTPVFDENERTVAFWVASRGHHADIGGTTPGSMPPNSTHISEEGILFTNWKLVEGGRFREKETREMLLSGPYPARNPHQNLADLRAQVAANEKGVQELKRVVRQYGLEFVQAYMGYVQHNAEEAVRRVIEALKDGQYRYVMDSGAEIVVKVTVHREERSATIDFTGTSVQLGNNCNAPAAICRAAVLYVFRSLVSDEIPLNDGCLKPIRLIIPEGSMLNPSPPAAVVAGNVETSQAITNALYAALGVLAGSQGTMNCFTFGNERYQYLETLAGGSAAGPGFDGTDVVQTHMTNSRLTDPEVLETRFPVRVESHSIRIGSGGRGRWKGGDGAVRRIRFLEAMSASILSNNRRIPPFGMDGGEPGALGINEVERADDGVQRLDGCATVEVRPGDVFVIQTPGGGGFGTP